MEKEVFTKVGIPRICILTGVLISFLICSKRHVSCSKSTKLRQLLADHNGTVERFNRTLASLLRKFGNQAQDDWDELLPICALAVDIPVCPIPQISPNVWS